MDKQIIYDWRRLWNFMLIKWWELETSESEAKLWKEDQSSRVKKEKWENAFSGKHVDNEQKETHEVSVMTS